MENKNAVKRRASQTVILETLVSFVKLLAPVLSSTAEEMWSYLRGYVKEESVFLAAFPSVRKEYINTEIEEEWAKIWDMRELINKKIEEKRVEKVIGHSLDAKVIITLPENDYLLLKKAGEELKDIIIVSQVELQQGDEIDIIVRKADGEKCERCWQYTTEMTISEKFPRVCKRCESILSSL